MWLLAIAADHERLTAHLEVACDRTEPPRRVPEAAFWKTAEAFQTDIPPGIELFTGGDG